MVIDNLGRLIDDNAHKVYANSALMAEALSAGKRLFYWKPYLIKGLKTKEMPWEISIVCEDTLLAAEEIKQTKFVKIPRSVNEVASQVWKDSLPSQLGF